jgi:spermidine synthase
MTTRKITGSGMPVIVFERGDYRALVMAESPGLVQGYRHRDQSLDFRFEYLDAHLAATFMAPRPKRILCLGLGVGAIPHLLKSMYPEIHMDAVELNDTVVHAAYKHFGLDTVSELTVFTQCAADFVREHPSSAYDLVFADCYDAFGIPDVCRTQEFIENTANLIADGGLLVANLIPNKRGVQEALAGWVGEFCSSVVMPGVRKSNQTFVGRRRVSIDIKAALSLANEHQVGSNHQALISALQRAIPAARYVQ